MEKKFVSKVFLISLLLATILLLRLFWTYISAIILALLISSAFYPIYNKVKRLLKNNEGAASIIGVTLIAIILIVPVGGFVVTLSNEAFDFYRKTKDVVSIAKIQKGLQGNSTIAIRIRRLAKMANVDIGPETLHRIAGSLGKNVGLFLSKQIRSMATNVLSFLIHLFIMLLIIYYIFRDGNRLKEYISELVPFPATQQELIVSKFREMGRAIILGNGLSGAVQGLLGGLGFYLFGLGSPILWGTLTGFLAFLPVVGASVVFIPATIILLLQSKTKLAIIFFIYNIFYSSIMEYIIKPRLIGKGMKMNPVLVFIGILGGLKLFGILGIIYGPLIITIFLTLAELYRTEYKEYMT